LTSACAFVLVTPVFSIRSRRFHFVHRYVVRIFRRTFRFVDSLFGCCSSQVCWVYYRVCSVGSCSSFPRLLFYCVAVHARCRYQLLLFWIADCFRADANGDALLRCYAAVAGDCSPEHSGLHRTVLRHCCALLCMEIFCCGFTRAGIHRSVTVFCSAPVHDRWVHSVCWFDLCS